MSFSLRNIIKSLSLLALASVYSASLYAQEENGDPVCDVLENIIHNPFGDMIGSVLQEGTDSIFFSDEKVSGIMELVNDYYLEQTVNPDVPLNVLTYLSDAYSGHGFYETGYWGGIPRKYSPIYNGPVPHSTPSDFYRPVWGMITSGFGYRQKYGRVHKGVDISLSVGDTVRAALPGVVTFVSYDAGGYGNYIVLAHSGGMETRYAHLNNSLVRPGVTVSAGEPIAIGGNTGNSTGPHLHFETRYLGVAIDPRDYFDFNLRSFSAGKR